MWLALYANVVNLCKLRGTTAISGSWDPLAIRLECFWIPDLRPWNHPPKGRNSLDKKPLFSSFRWVKVQILHNFAQSRRFCWFKVGLSMVYHWFIHLQALLGRFNPSPSVQTPRSLPSQPGWRAPAPAEADNLGPSDVCWFINPMKTI
jgi:hypothetical protein